MERHKPYFYRMGLVEKVTAAIAASAFAAILYFTSGNPPNPDDSIKYLGQSKGTHHVAVVGNYGLDISYLSFDAEGNKIEEKTFRRSSMMYSPFSSYPNLADITEEASKDFPVGAVFHSMLGDAKERQQEMANK